MNFCIACKHCNTTNPNPEYWECISPQNNKGYNLVTGKQKSILVFCESHRDSDTLGCTKSGKWFEEISNVIPK